MKSRLSLSVISWGLALMVLSLIVLLQPPITQARPLADTIIPGGTLTSDTTWTMAGSPYVVQGDVTVASGVTLTVQPGVIVKFNANTSLNVQAGGRLIAQGNIAQPIAFTSSAASPAAGDWGYVQVQANGSARLSYCDLGYGGVIGHWAVLYLQASDVNVDHCRIHDSATDGVRLWQDDITPTLSNLTIDHNVMNGILQLTVRMNPTYVNLSFNNNGFDGVNLVGEANGENTVGRQITLDGSGLNGAPLLASGLSVSAGSIVTITPGTTLEFPAGASAYGLAVVSGGQLIAQGTASRPITFTSSAVSPQPGDWGYLDLQPGSSTRLSNCDVSYGGAIGRWALLYIRSSGVTIENCRLHDSATDGVRLWQDDIAPTFRNVTIDHNGLNAIQQYSVRMTPSFGNVVLRNNGFDGDRLTGDANGGATMGRNIKLDGNGLNGAPFAMNNLSINSGSVVTLTPGTTLQIEPNGGIGVADNSALLAQGAANLPITFTSSLTNPVPGSWNGIDASALSTVHLAYCDIGYGGNSGAGPQANLQLRGADASVEHCHIHDSQTDGVRTFSGHVPASIAYNTINQNQRCGVLNVFESAEPVLTLRFNNIRDNAGGGVCNENTSASINARENFWGDATGPYHPTLNPGGLGNAVSDHVAFRPWLNQYEVLWPDRSLLNGLEQLQWGYFGTTQGLTVTLIAHSTNGDVILGNSLLPNGGLFWYTPDIPNGTYQVEARYFKNGTLLGNASRTYVVQNSAGLCVHRAAITSDETWAADCVHVVLEDITVDSGVTLTVAPGAIVKFEKDRGLSVESGGTLQAGSASIFTALADDVGGDTNLDNDQSQPTPGDWLGFNGTGALNLAVDTEVRYVQFNRTGTLGSHEVWTRGSLYVLTGQVQVPANGTLTIEPGVIVKFDRLAELDVNSGGTLIARGTRAQPIVFTSLRDDSVGGDTNGDGDLSQPAYGDWNYIHLNSARGDFDYVQIRYGGNTFGGLRSEGAPLLSVNHALIRDIGADGIYAFDTATYISNTVVARADRGLNVGSANYNLVNVTVDQTNTGLSLHGGTAHVRNNSVTNYQTTGIAGCCGVNVAELGYNNVWSSIASATALGGVPSSIGTDGNISADARYRNVAADDYRIGYDSPLVDAANTPGAPIDDRFGTPRCNGSSPTRSGVPSNGVYADIGAHEVCDNAPSNFDLIAGNVSGPASITAGDTITVEWDVTNIGSEPIQGGWHDRISLVGPDTLSVDELLNGPDVLAPGEHVHKVAQVRVPGGRVGSYHWQVTTNSRGEVFEGRNTANNDSVSAATTALDLPELIVGGAATVRSVNTAGTPLWFKFNPPAGQDVLVSITRADNTGVTQAYLARSTMPTQYSFDAQQNPFVGANVSLYAANTLSDTYYVMVVPRTLPNGATQFSVHATAVGFALSTVTPGTVGAGTATLQFSGSRFSSDAAYQLIAPNSTVYAATRVTVPDPSSAFAQFDLTGATIGTYTARVIDPVNGTRTLNNAVHVQAAQPISLVVSLAVPDAIRANREGQGLVVYENKGNTDIVAPLITIDTGGKAGLRVDAGGDFQLAPLNLIGVSPDGPADVLRPGERGQAQFYIYAPTTSNEITWTQRYRLATSTEPIDFAALEPQLHSTAVTDDQWAAMWSLFQARVGSTWGGYVNWLAS